jgi:hypothetical protein
MGFAWIDEDRINKLERALYNAQMYGGKWNFFDDKLEIIIDEQDSDSGTSVKWAKITAVTDANNYTASIWTDRNETDPAETGKALYVYDIADALAVNDWIPVQASNRTGKDYENIQQLGLL